MAATCCKIMLNRDSALCLQFALHIVSRKSIVVLAKPRILKLKR